MILNVYVTSIVPFLGNFFSILQWFWLLEEILKDLGQIHIVFFWGEGALSIAGTFWFFAFCLLQELFKDLGQCQFVFLS